MRGGGAHSGRCLRSDCRVWMPKATATHRQPSYLRVPGIRGHHLQNHLKINYCINTESSQF